MNILKYNGKDFEIDGKTSFYFFETFGYPPELFEELVNERLKDPKIKSQLIIQVIIQAFKEYKNGN